MKTLVLAAIGLGTAIMWLVQQRHNQRSRSTTKKLALLAAKGLINFDEIGQTFDTLVMKKSYTEDVPLHRLDEEDFLKTELTVDRNKYFLQSIHRNNNRYLLIGEVKVKDLLPTHSGNKDVDKYYSANLLITFESSEKEILFHSAFPDDNEHYYLLNDLAAAIYESLTK
jgi:hypothetical protein